MSIFGLFSGKKPPLHAVIDVGSHSIKSVIFEAPAEKKSPQTPLKNTGPMPRVLKKMVAILPWSSPQPDVAGAAMSDEERKYAFLRIAARLREIVFTMVRKLERVPEQIIIAVGPNWAQYELAELRVPLPKGKKTILRRNLTRLFAEALKARKDNENEINHPLSLTINGYPFPLRGSDEENLPIWGDIVFKVLRLSLSEERARLLFQLRQSLGGMPIKFLPLAASYGEALTGFSERKNIFAVDAGGEYTTLLFFREGELVRAEAFPLGARYFIRGIAKIASISVQEAEDEKRRYVQGLMPVEKKIKIQEFLAEESKLWEEKFLDALASFYAAGPLPPDVLLFGGGAHLPEISAILKKSAWLSNLSYATEPRVRIIEAPAIFDGNSFGGAIRGPEEVGLASLMKYAINKNVAG